jgi:hypothetical protein
MGESSSLRRYFSHRAPVVWALAAIVIGAGVWLAMKLRRDTYDAAPPAVAGRTFQPPTGYVGSKACAECHSEIAESYAQTHSMSRSAAAIAEATKVEEHSQPSFASPDGRVYRIEEREGSVFHHETMFDRVGEPIYDQAEEITCVIGSGRRGRGYLVNREGQLFQSPISWYAQAHAFGLSPGYAPGNHQRFDRKMVFECLVCHVGRTAIEDRGLNRFGDPPFLEAGIGCERCHGPGEEHVRRHSSGELAGDDPIVNPAHLDPWRRDSVCYQCHLRAEMIFPRKGADYFDYIPGKRFDDVWVAFAEDVSRGEVTGVVPQFRSSTCYLASQGKLGCISCHDPHSRPAVEERPAYYRRQCLKCHGENDCAAPLVERQAPPASGSCIHCHMPPLPTHDVPHTALVDHRILRDPKNEPQVAKSDSGDLSLILFLEEGTSLPKKEETRAQGLALAMKAAATNQLELAQDSLELLATAYGDSENIASREDDPGSLANIGIAQVITGHSNEALATWERALALEPNHEITLHSLTAYYSTEADPRPGIPFARRLVEINPHVAEHHWLLATLLDGSGRLEEAIPAAEKAIQLDPTALKVRGWLIQAYVRSNRTGEALQQRDILQRFQRP